MSPPDPGLWGLFLVGLGSSVHCVGMCGGYVLAAGGRGEPAGGRVPWKRALGTQGLYHLGKATSYLFLGALAGLAGAWLLRGGTWVARALSTAGALALLLAGLGALGLGARWKSGPGAWARRAAALAWAPVASGVISLRSPLAPLYLGTLSGLLPCPLVYAFAACAAARGNVLQGVLVLGSLALATVPALFVVGCTGQLVPPGARTFLARASGWLLIALGVWTGYRGWVEPACCGGLGF